VTAAPATPASTQALVLPDDMNGAMQRLLRLWKQNGNLPAGSEACTAVNVFGLRCFTAYGDLDDLRRFNLPAILQLRDQGGRRQLLLRGLSADAATLESSEGVETRKLDQLQRDWTGDFVLLWQPGVTGNRVGRQSRGEDVRWLRRQLALANGETAPAEPLSDSYDRDLGIRVRAFQAVHGLSTDGIAGTRTLIMLTNLAPAPGAPRLVQAAQKGG
jgi:general secretion pathway protein A